MNMAVYIYPNNKYQYILRHQDQNENSSSTLFIWKSRIMMLFVVIINMIYMLYSDINIDKASLSLILSIYLLVFTTNVYFLETNLTTWSFYSHPTTREVKAKTCAHYSGSQETWVKRAHYHCK